MAAWSDSDAEGSDGEEEGDAPAANTAAVHRGEILHRLEMEERRGGLSAREFKEKKEREQWNRLLDRGKVRRKMEGYRTETAIAVPNVILPFADEKGQTPQGRRRRLGGIQCLHRRL